MQPVGRRLKGFAAGLFLTRPVRGPDRDDGLLELSESVRRRKGNSQMTSDITRDLAGRPARAPCQIPRDIARHLRITLAAANRFGKLKQAVVPVRSAHGSS